MTTKIYVNKTVSCAVYRNRRERFAVERKAIFFALGTSWKVNSTERIS